jgi:hypothetical protein
LSNAASGAASIGLPTGNELAVGAFDFFAYPVIIFCRDAVRIFFEQGYNGLEAPAALYQLKNHAMKVSAPTALLQTGSDELKQFLRQCRLIANISL